MRFTDKVCLVTGAGSGIGRAAAQRFAAEGGRVAVVDIDDAGGRETVRIIEADGGEAMFVRADVGDGDDVRAAVERAAGWHGRLDVVVNDAGMMAFEPVAKLAEADWDRVLRVNLRSVFLFSKHALTHLKQGGAIVNVSSVHAHETTANVSAYAASKGGMEAFTRALSRECADRKVRANCVAPGAVDTPLLWSNPNVKSGAEKVEGAVGQPADIAAAIAFLAADEARFITGATLVVDGGRLDIL
jgi:glucose 1-dehydrogenase